MEQILPIVIYITYSIGLFLLAKNSGDEKSFFAFLPILQIYLLVDMAGLGITYFFLIIGLSIFSYLWPIVQIIGLIVLFIIHCFAGIRATQKVWLSIIASMVPGIGIFVLGIYSSYRRKKSLKKSLKKGGDKISIEKQHEINYRMNLAKQGLSLVQCSNCNKKLKIKTEIKEKMEQGKCPNCKQLIVF